MIKGIAHVCVSAKDLVATERFYCSGLGFKKHFDFIKGGEIIGFYLEVAKGSYVEVFRNDKIDSRANAPIAHICLEVDDIDEAIRRLTSQGYPAENKTLGADQSWQVWTTDPNGVRIEFHQYTPDSSQRTGADCILD